MNDNEENLIENLEVEPIENEPPKDKYKKYDNFVLFVLGTLIFIVTILTFVVNWKIGLIFLGSAIFIGIIYYYVRKFINK